MGSRLPNHDVKGWKELQKNKEKKKIKNKKKLKGRLHQTGLESKHNRKYQSI